MEMPREKRYCGNCGHFSELAGGSCDAFAVKDGQGGVHGIRKGVSPQQPAKDCLLWKQGEAS